ncbi:MAG: DoxX family protein [Balneolaceae bacterium]
MFLTGKRLDLGLLFLRLGIGTLFIFHGLPKIMGGPERWEMVGGAMSNLGINSFHIFFGFAAAVAEVFGGIFLILGLYTLPALILLICTMIVAFVTQLAREAGFSDFSHPLSLGVVFIAMLMTGPGKHSLDEKLSKKRRRSLFK